MIVNSWSKCMRAAYNSSSAYYAPGVIREMNPIRHAPGMSKKRPRGKFPNKIALWRNLAKLDQTELGERVGRKQETIARYESGEINPPSSILAKMAEALRCTEQDLLKRAPGPQDEYNHEFHELTPEGQKQAVIMLRVIKESEKTQ